MTTLADLVSSYKITGTFHFVPHSHSRNAEDKFPCLNWRYRLMVGDILLISGDYNIGTGIGRKPTNVMLTREQQVTLCEEGRVVVYGPRGVAAIKAITPTVEDVLACLLREAQSTDVCFKEWAENFGYSDDSIRAFNIYNECLRTAMTLRQVLGATRLASLYEAAFDDYDA